MRSLIISICFLISLSCYSQDYKKVDSIVKTYTRNFSSVSKLAEQIETDFSNDYDKVRAIYNWITSNITYDIKEKGVVTFSYNSTKDYNKKNEKKLKKLSKRVLSKKIAVCEGYATLFNQLCLKLNIKSKIITGSAKTETSDIGKRFSATHAWNIIEISNKKYLIDTTWGVDITKDNGINYSYFLTLPRNFILNHYPNNFKDALLEKPISKEKFLTSPLYYTYYFEMISPKNGLIYKSKSKLITFTLKSKKEINSVILEINKKFYDVDLVQNEDTFQFAFDISKSPNAKEIIIYFNNEAAIGYKLKK